MFNDTILNKQQYDLLIQTIGEDIVKALWPRTSRYKRQII